ncbi:MAG: 2-isopropylmalate synthase, partial [Candidatus Sumerlaeia bacterium]|nr:2-isopropylmalate synthase [Candidatus Sumerlaeia bacterium]
MTPTKDTPKSQEPKPKPERVIIFDTTLRDGEQAPGFTMHLNEKLKVAHQLAKLGVDVIEAGFAIASPGDFDAVAAISEEVKGPVICSLSRALPKDIEASGRALAKAPRRRIHTFIATSDIHVQRKLKMSREQVIAQAVSAVKLAKTFTDDVEFSCEDAGRTDWDYMCAVIEAAIEAGATTINIPDTVGYCTPWQFGDCIAYIRNKVPNIGKCVLSVHCHNDLGLAVANSLAGILAGARQVECTINGIGERAGNAALEEIVANLKTRQDFYKCDTAINTKEIYRTSRLVSQVTGTRVQPNKAVVGANAFAHEAGIHQDGILKERATYEIMTPESVGWTGESIILGKHSGRHAFRKRLEAMGYGGLSPEMIEQAFDRFIKLCDKKKVVYDEDLMAILEDEIVGVPQKFQLDYLSISSGTATVPTATVRMKIDGEIRQDAGCGDGPVDAAYTAIERITGIQAEIAGYSLEAVTSGGDAVGRVRITAKFGGHTVSGLGADTDIIVASAKALVNA